MLSLLVVQLIVAGVSAAGGSRNHGSGLGVGESRRCIVPRTCHDKTDETGLVTICVRVCASHR